MRYDRDNYITINQAVIDVNIWQIVNNHIYSQMLSLQTSPNSVPARLSIWYPTSMAAWCTTLLLRWFPFLLYNWISVLWPRLMVCRWLPRIPVIRPQWVALRLASTTWKTSTIIMAVAVSYHRFTKSGNFSSMCIFQYAVPKWRYS